MINYFKEVLNRINFGRNTTPKTVSILFAIVLYIFVMGEINPEETRKYNNIPVQLLNLDELEREGLILIDNKEFSVEATLVGTRNELAEISMDDVHITADLRGFKEGVSSIPLDLGEISNIHLKVSPMQIKVRLDEIVQRKKTIEIASNGKPKEDYIASSVVANPSEIIVEGSKTKVETIDKIIGEVDITDLNDNINKDVAIKPVDSKGNDVIGVELKTSKVNVDVIIDNTKNAEVEVPIIGTVKNGYKLVSVKPGPKRIFIKGKEGAIKDLKVVLTEPINIESLSKTVTVPVNLNLPEGVLPVYMSDPISVEIKVEKIETKEFNYKARQVSISNLDDELTTNISSNDSDIKVIISDVRSVLDKVTWSDLQLVINANDLPEGSYDLKPRVLNKNEFIKVDIVPTNINVEVKSKSTQTSTETNSPVDSPVESEVPEPSEDNVPVVDLVIPEVESELDIEESAINIEVDKNEDKGNNELLKEN